MTVIFICPMSSAVWAVITWIPQMRMLINKRNLFLPVLEAEKSEIKVSTDSISGEVCFPVFKDSGLHPVSSYGSRGEQVLWGPFFKGTNPVHEGSTSWPNNLPKPSLPSTITLGSSFNTWILVSYKHPTSLWICSRCLITYSKFPKLLSLPGSFDWNVVLINMLNQRYWW